MFAIDVAHGCDFGSTHFRLQQQMKLIVLGLHDGLVTGLLDCW